MTSNLSPTLENNSPAEVSRKIPHKPESDEAKGRFAQERIMLAIAAIFIGGVLAMTLIPAPINGIISGLVLFLTLYAMFRVR